MELDDPVNSTTPAMAAAALSLPRPLGGSPRHRPGILATFDEDVVDGEEEDQDVEMQMSAMMNDEGESGGSGFNDSTLTATPLKLHVSTEEEGSEESQDAFRAASVSSAANLATAKQQSAAEMARRKLLSLASAYEKKEETVKVPLKRKHYSVRRSGSGEYLLGFDEENGEAEFAKEHVKIFSTITEKLAYEEMAISPIASPRTAKISKQEPTTVMPSVNSSPTTETETTVDAIASSPPPPPKALKQNAIKKIASDKATTSPVPPTLPPLPTRSVQLQFKPHIVADNEDTTNGGIGNVTAATTTAINTTSSTISYNNNSNSSSTSIPGTTTVLPNAQTSKKPLSAQDDFYKKPFEYGWKRELVWRANMETSKDKADVYFITPAGKKLRTRSDILPLLEGELTIDHFSFAREPLGVGTEFETVRSAKPSSRASAAAATLAAAPPPQHMGKRISKPKGPKGASPPPQGWTPTRALKVNNAALLSSAGSSSRYSNSVSMGGGGGGKVTPATPPSNRHSSSNAQHNTSGGGGGGGGSSSATGTSSNKGGKSKKNHAASSNIDMSAAAAVTASSSLSLSRNNSHEPCTYKCSRAPGQVPQLKCIKCLCLYHHECVGLSRHSCEYSVASGTNAHNGGRAYICEACVPKLDASTSKITAITSTASSSSSSSLEAGKSSFSVARTANTGNNNTFTTPKRSATVASRNENKFPQTIAVVKGKKYVMVAKPIGGGGGAGAAHPATNEHIVNDIENDLKQINESIRNSRKPSAASLDAAFQLHNASTGAAGAVAVEHSNRFFATNFFSNLSFAYDTLLGIFKYLKTHERPRAASVCKLWHLAAKDTSLWQTVRMKNSKVCNWAGFAAALRRGETKHLDLRKMLIAGARSGSGGGAGEEMWQDFCLHIGSVGTLEQIDLCRCSARVVEHLFESNGNLRVLNAVAINDDAINLENISHLTQLQELRLRTCEPGVITGTLQPLQPLTQLSHLSLTAIRGLGARGVEVLGDLVHLTTLELGECGDFDGAFSGQVLPRLKKLQRLRLENGQETSCCTLAILEAVAGLEQLTQLELVNFDIKSGFDERLRQCSNIRKLLIIPTYISQSATTNHIVLSAVQQVATTLTVFTWGVTVELLRVTALYVDQCEESTKKEKHHFDECIPVLKPVPGAPAANAATDDDDDADEEAKSGKNTGPSAGTTEGDGVAAASQRRDDETATATSEVPQIEILPLDKVESILRENLPTTKFTIVKVPYHVTCKQQLME